MTKYQYLIVGGGMTADAAVRGIRAAHSKGTIGLFSLEPDQPYKRPLLSKGLWLEKPLDQAWLKTESLGVDIHLGTGIVSIDPEQARPRRPRRRTLLRRVAARHGRTPAGCRSVSRT